MNFMIIFVDGSLATASYVQEFVLWFVQFLMCTVRTIDGGDLERNMERFIHSTANISHSAHSSLSFLCATWQCKVTIQCNVYLKSLKSQKVQ